MVTDLQVLFVIELLLVFLIVFDSMNKRDWMGTRRLIVIVLITVLVPVIGAVIYIAVIRRHQRQLVRCPECGDMVEESADTCPHCGFDPDAAREQDEGPHRCGSCGSEFDTARGLMRHRARHHENGDGGDTEDASSETKDVRTESHECPECGAAFDTERGLHVHESVKHG
jgi:ribosomal protein L37AE/L43A